MGLTLALLTTAACGEPAEGPPAAHSAEGLAALADAAPGGALAVGWRAVDELGVAAWLFYPVSPHGKVAAARTPLPSVPEEAARGLRRRFGAVAAATLIAAPGHALPGAPMAEGDHPLIVFAPGAAMGGRDYRLFVEALASRGMVVAVLHPAGSPGASDERYSEAASEITLAIAKLRGMASGPDEGRFDAARPVLVGHSLGGAAAVLAAARTGACAVNIDGDFGGESAAAEPQGLLLYVIGDPARDRPADIARRAEIWRGVASRSGERAMALGIVGMRHFDLADAAHLPSALIPADRREGRFGSIGGAGARRVLVDLVSRFAQACHSAGNVPLSAAVRLPPEARSAFTR